MKAIAVLMSLALVTACGVPPEDKINAQLPTDGAMTCEEIAAERVVNDDRIANLTKSKALSSAGNFGTSIGNQSARSLSDPDQADIDRLSARNAVLDDLSAQQNCG